MGDKSVKNGKIVNPSGSATEDYLSGNTSRVAKIGKNGKMVKPVGSLTDGLIVGINLQGI